MAEQVEFQEGSSKTGRGDKLERFTGEGFPKTEGGGPGGRVFPMSGVGFQERGLSQDGGGRPRREGFAQDQEQDIAKIRAFGGKKRNFRNLLHLMVHLYSLLIPNT